MSADAPGTLAAFKRENHIKHALLADWPARKMLTAYDALVTDPNSLIYRYAKRAYFILDKDGTVKYVKVMEKPTEILSADDVLKAIKDSGAA